MTTVGRPKMIPSLVLALVASSALAGCGAAMAPEELNTARDVYKKASTSPAVQLACNPLIDSTLGEIFGYPDGVPNCLRIRAAMTNYADPVEAEQRSAAIFRIVHAFLEIVKSALREISADFPRNRSL